MNDDTSLPNSETLPLNSGWNETLTTLCEELKSSSTCSKARDRFFEGYQYACQRVATRILSRWKWRGDIQCEAEDIASESTKILLKQEEQGGGIFGSKPTSDSQLRGYLFQTMRKSCVRIAVRRQPRMVLLSLDQLLDAGGDCRIPHSRPSQEIRAELMEILDALEATRSTYRKLPDGVQVLDCLLATEIGDGRIDGLPKRTLQRYAKQIREFLARHRDVRDDVH